MAKSVSLLLLFTFFQTVFGQPATDPVLRRSLQPLLEQHRGDVGLVIQGLDSGVRYEFNADVPMPTASLIKLPILITVYRQVQEGRLDLSRQVPVTRDDKVAGSGILAGHFSDGISLPLRDLARLMIRYSDNTATNLVIEQIGLPATTAMMESLGLEHTKLHSKVFRRDSSIAPVRSSKFGIGSTTAGETTQILSRLASGELLSKELTGQIIEHLSSCDDNTKIAAGLSAGVKFAHKTGAVSNCRTDAGIIYTATEPVAVCLLTNKNEDQSWADNNQAHQLAASVGRIIVERFGHSQIDHELQEGASGKIVESLQRTLNQRLIPSPQLAVDGEFGPATRSAVERFQGRHGLEETGIVTEMTWEALGMLLDQDDPVPLPAEINSRKLSRVSQNELTVPPVVTARAWVIADGRTGEVVEAFNANTRLEAASTTKIMTALLVIRLVEQNPQVLNELVEFSEAADRTKGSTSGLRAGERVSVHDLLHGLLLPSGNDAAVALAEHFGPQLVKASALSEEKVLAFDQFVDAMNAMSDRLGMNDAHYENPHGLPNKSHVISANNLLRLTQEALKSELFRKIVNTRQYGCTVNGPGGYERNVMWKNTNELLKIEGYSGVKTGTTSVAGACLVARGQRNDDQLIVILLGSSSSRARYADARNLFHWAWRQRVASAKIRSGQ